MIIRNRSKFNKLKRGSPPEYLSHEINVWQQKEKGGRNGPPVYMLRLSKLICALLSHPFEMQEKPLAAGLTKIVRQRNGR